MVDLAINQRVPESIQKQCQAMDARKPKHLEVVEIASRRVGACVGTATVIGKRIVGVGLGSVAALGSLLRRPLKAPGRESGSAAAQREREEARREAEKAQSQLASQPRLRQAKKESLTAGLHEARHKAGETIARERPPTLRAAALERGHAAARRELEQTRTEVKRAQSQLASRLGTLQRESKSDLAAVRHEFAKPRSEEESNTIAPLAKEVESSTEATAARPDEERDARTEVQESRAPAAETEAPSPPGVTLEEVRAAVFLEAGDRMTLTRALCDIASQDAAVRADAAGVMARVRHQLSVRALVAQLACESSPKVQQACIKALAKLEMKEGLPAVERALTSRVAAVRLAAVWGVYRLGGAESAPALTRVLSDDDEEVRRRAVTCIGWLGQEAFAVELLPLLDDSTVPVRRAAVEAMGNLRSWQVVPPLIERLNDPEESIRTAALCALETITGKKMSGSSRADEKSHQRLIARWRIWWRDKHAQ